MFVFKVPYDKGGEAKSFGAKYGPDAIEAAFKRWPWRVSEDGISLPDVTFLKVVNQGRAEKAIFDSYTTALRLLLADDQRSFAALSGDNSCSFYTAKGLAERFPDPHLVLLDAHPDAGDPASHDPHASWVRKLWETGVVRPEKTFFFGTRDPEEDEMRYVKESGATMTSADTLSRMSPQVIVANLVLHGKIKPRGGLIFVVDIDVIDPSQAPGTGVLRSPGLELRTVLQLISIFGDMPFSLKVGEISEVIPHEGDMLRPPDDRRPDPAGLTVLAGEAILRQMIRSFA